MKTKPQNNLLAVRVEPWQLFRFRKIVEWRKSRPSTIIQEALQIYSASIPRDITEKWLDEYHAQKGAPE